ncbi:hypothetical protein PVL29_001935 [Vitis rotundifolia]|uniref:Uncharacterized protein n=1 Tax=Vitis rotundifolia TaxID=103349 RepID=A0AA39E4F4_VITRO|nr:hypothetical protein PVL29_001935 [Vitis rotundifolia]
MGNKGCQLFPIMVAVFLLSLIFMCSFSSAVADQETELMNELSEAILEKDVAIEESDHLQTYIVHVKRAHRRVFTKSDGLESWYESFLPVASASPNRKQRIVYSYRNVLNGFAAKLTAQEVKAMEEKDGFVSARLQRILPLHTTHSPSFLGLHQELGFWKGSNYGKGVIIGVLDTGLFPDHPSFSDEGLPPPPAKWKGKCDFNWTSCNNKIIGARNFDSGAEAVPPIDEEGHGTHTASTAAGNFVPNADALGNANGTAVGMAPLAHLAIYKVCSEFGCADTDILAALDTAIEDGVDVLSLSLGGGSAPFFADSIALGAFSAIQKGIFVSCSAGNSGPLNGSLSNEAPWILTVGASTIDRKIMATATLGNGEEFDGESLFQPSDFPSTLLPLVYAGANGNASSSFCAPESLKDVDVAGKVVVCDRGGGIGRIDKGQEVKDAGGAAMILTNDELNGFSTLADAHVLPATHVSYAAGLKIKSYIKSESAPTATIVFKGTIIGVPTAPEVTSFSSRGPSLESPGILKPDIIGPGVSILAAWPFPLENDTTSKPTFNVISGTSMSCPHLSGIAALIKSAHPDWSPAAIKSAIITTADLHNLENKPIIDETFQPADLFATGAGHVNPSAANDPGLIYDLEPDDYIPYLCGLGYTDEEVGLIVNRTLKCSEESAIPEAQLNYPSFSIALGPSSLTYSRTVSNVGAANSSYSVQILAPSGVEVSVNPDKLEFTEVNQKITYMVSFSRTMPRIAGGKPFAQGFLKWVSDSHSVRSPISVMFE